MMMQGDFDLNPVQICTDSLKEVLKQTMFNQDFVFRNQVHELHRLYRVQESLMKDFGWKKCNTYNSLNPKAQSSLANPTRYEPPAKETRFSSTAKVDSKPFISQELIKDCQGTYHKLQHRPLDLRLSADEFINHVEEDFRKKGNFYSCLDGLRDFKLPLSDGNSSDAEELKLSLSIGRNDRKMGSTMRTCFNWKTYSSSQNVIDLEESVEGIPNGMEKDLSHEIAESSSIQEQSDVVKTRPFPVKPPVGISEELGCYSGDQKSDSVELKPKLAREVSCEKSEVENSPFSCTDQSQNTLLEEHGNKSPASWQSYCISDNDSSSANRKHSGIASHLGSQLIDALMCEHDERISDSSDLKNSCCKKKEESAQVDVFIQQAAELLIHISSEHSA
ncbi:hypothetical protein GH714_008983 [Hevea brasiliensis]|uniref:Uncharacterized protein n=1 Tax=Hevea brasiliensis TaxID=3981 RepID=A0A6A6MH56_HEVBR|nr:hypothetical protein GH714_008983 [Hevea brasiliensis]